MTQHQAFDRPLAKHTVDRITFHTFRARFPRLHGKNARIGYHGFGGEVLAAKLYTNQGACGWGRVCGSIDQGRAAAQFLLGKTISEIFSSGTGILRDELKPLDIALHDLAGVILGVPVAKMIIDTAVLHARVYDGAIYMNDIIPEDRPQGVEQILKDCEYDYSLGHRIFKVKIGRGNRWMPHDEGLNRDIQVVRAIYKSFPDAGIMVDANDGYSLADTVAFLEGVKEVPIIWFEEPFREEESADRALREYLDINRPDTLIADGESDTDIDLLRNLSEKRLLDVWQPDICGQGFTGWRTLMKELSAKGWVASPHAWGNVVKTHYCLHLAAAYPHHINYIESVLGESEGVDYSGYTLRNGVISIPNKPGFGMDLIWAPEV